jgi:hypothetical protein
MAKTKFTAPSKDAYTANIQSKAEQEQEQQTPARKKSYARDAEFYRFNLKMPIECKTYLQEMVWRQSVELHRTVTITDYIAQLVLEDMEKHPEIMESIDELNT